MRFYHLIQEKIFHTYEEWHLRSNIFNRTGFHIVTIRNQLQAMRDGFNMYVELRPPHAVDGCSSMKAACGKRKEQVDLYLHIRGKAYVRAGLPYDEAVRIMKDFVQKSALPDVRAYDEVHADGAEKIAAFRALSVLLLGDTKRAQHFLKKAAPQNAAEIDDAWDALSEEMLSRERALELDWKSDRDAFLHAVRKLTAGTGLAVDEVLFDEAGSIPSWSGALNAQWTEHVLAAMDIGSDSYVLLVLTRADFAKAEELARKPLHRIAPAEEM